MFRSFLTQIISLARFSYFGLKWLLVQALCYESRHIYSKFSVVPLLSAKTGDQLAIAKETGRRLGMGTNMYPASSLLGRDRDENEALPVEELIEKADGFAGVFPGNQI